MRSGIHCEYLISTLRVTYAIDFEHSQWISEYTHYVDMTGFVTSEVANFND